LTTTEIGLLLVPTGAAGILGGWLGGRVLESAGPRALVAGGSLVGVAAYVSLSLSHSSWHALAIPTAALSFAVGLILTGIYPVVLRSARVETTGVAVAMVVVTRNIAVSLGVAVAFAILDGAGLASGFPAEEGFTRVFVMGAAAAAAALVSAAFMPGRTARVVR
jgi:predicted MFS family arabinose efflux permease